jgi:hypothetical protein
MEGVAASSSGLMAERARLRKVNIFIGGSRLTVVILSRSRGEEPALGQSQANLLIFLF